MAKKPPDKDESSRSPELSTPSSVETTFYLYTEKSVKSASIFWKKKEDKREPTRTPMTKSQSPKDDVGNIWMAKISFESSSTAEVEYYYKLERSSFPHGKKTTASEISPRYTQLGSTNYDSFCDEKDESAHHSARATICYSKWLLVTVDEQNFDTRVLAIRGMNFNFRRLQSEVVKKYVTWIFCKETDNSVPKCLYLGVLLALVNDNNDFDWQKKIKENLYKQFVDNLLCVLRSHEDIGVWCDIENNLVRCLKVLAPKLIQASSHPRWLTYATSFYSYLGAKQILSDSFACTQEYLEEEYKELVECLIPSMSRDRAKESQYDFLEMLERILLEAPTYEAIVYMYGDNGFLNLFQDHTKQTKLFGKVFEEKAKDILKRTGLLSKAVAEIEKIPEKLLNSMNAFSHILLAFIELPFDSSPIHRAQNSENSSAFCREMSCEKHFSTEEIKEVVHGLCMSNQPHCHEIFLGLLKSDFYKIWEKLGKDQHVSILSKWMAADLAHNPNKPPQCKPLNVFERAARLESSTVFTKGEEVIEKACFKAFERKNLKSYTTGSMLEALATVEGLSLSVQECYKKIFDSVLESSSTILKDIVAFSQKKCWFTDNSTRTISGLAESLLVQVLDWLTKKGGNYENEFYELIDWSDFWLTIVSAEGSVEEIQKHKMFMSVKESLRTLLLCLENNKISIRVFKNAEVHKESLSQIFACFQIKNKKAKSNFKIERKVCLDRIAKISSVVAEHDAKSNALQSAILTCRVISKKVKVEISDVAEVNNVLEKCKSNEQLVSDLQNDDFWGILSSVLELSKALNHLRESSSFKCVAERCFKQRRDSSKITLSDMLSFLAGICVQTFRSEWYDFLKKPESADQTVQKLEDLIGHNMLNKENLEREIGILVTLVIKKFPDKLKQYLHAYANHDQVLEKVKNALFVLQLLGFYSNSNTENLDLSTEVDHFPNIKDETTDLIADETSKPYASPKAKNSLAVIRTLESFTQLYKDKTKLSIKKHHSRVEEVQKYLTYNSHTESVLHQLEKCSDIVRFVQITVNEDLHFMVEEVQEHAEQLKVDESLVTELIDVHQFVGKIIKLAQSNTSVKHFFQLLDELVSKEESVGVDIGKMIQCVKSCNDDISSLDGLYKSVANRVEVSKRVIANCLRRGKSSVYVNEDGDCDAKITYSGINGEHFLQGLQNLRSRAYLIRNAAQKRSTSIGTRASFTKRNIDYNEFIEQVDLLTEICDLVTQIRPLEFLKYDEIKWNDLRGTSALRDKRDELKNDLETWQTALSAGRIKYFFLNFYRSCQLRILYQFFSDCSNPKHCDEALSIFKVIDPDIKMENVEERLKASVSDEKDADASKDVSPETLINKTGCALQTIFNNTEPRTRSLILPTNTSLSVEYVVKEGELFIVKLEDQSPQTVNVVLAVYANTCKSFPQPYEILFCGVNTQWEEVNLLLNRCMHFDRTEKQERKNLYCIANVDLLKKESRIQLLKRLKEQANDMSNSRLVLICRGKNCNQFFEEFSEYAHQICGLTDTALTTCLERDFPNVVVYTSALPGLGKTEKIKTDACEKGKNIITCAIYDSVDWNKLVSRLKCLSIRSYHCLHFNIGHVDDPSLLDSFLFQLVVVGMLSSETQLFHLPTSHVYIEIANTLQDSLRDSLQICKYFKSARLRSFKFEDMMVSSDIHSNVQIVCRYLEAHHGKSLEDRDIFLRDEKNEIAKVPPTICRTLLSEYFPKKQDISFTILKTFLAVLADQLRKFSECAYFKIASLDAMLGEKGRGIRTIVFLTLVNVSKDFALRSIRTHCFQPNDEKSSVQRNETKSSIEAMIKRVEGMVRWEDSNHLILVFHGRDSQTATAMYRNKDDVPENVKELLKSQTTRADRGNQDIADYSSMGTDELRMKLLRIVSTTNTNHDANPDPTYVITSDNIHKMILIILRVRGRIPVILMGETGCGKTRLVKYLAATCKISLSVFCLHAGIHEQQIIQYIEKREIEAMNKEKKTWIFLDEINTTDHIGLIGEIMCHHSLFGRPLSKKLVFIAACNPYKLRSEESITTAGLDIEGKSISDEYSRLIYQVHPLPEGMIDYVWDFGFLKEDDEMSYIRKMVSTSNQAVIHGKTSELLATLLAASQTFVRKVEGNFGVSLRDVNRCIALIKWFRQTLAKIREYPIPKETMPTSLCEESDLKSYILGLAHCYMYRLSTTKLRNKYCIEMEKHLKDYRNTNQTFIDVVRMMEENFLKRMELPQGISANNSLLENVFVMLVCILNRIPVFVVGKPGCSKSLSMRLIKSHLRGRDSTDAYFKTLPHIYVVSYQSSESSTSEGIEKAFEKAHKYAKCNKDILPVVLLDEVGLAGCSKHNPLKVLHSLLEPESSTGKQNSQEKPKVAVVGISNWTLDAAKMNRAIHLSKPDPDVEDLHHTAISIICDVTEHGLDSNSQKQVRHLAESYHKYQPTQKFPNFHGLRDYYSLIRNLIEDLPNERTLDINFVLQRNFGGHSRSEIANIQNIFLEKPRDESFKFKIYPVTELVQQNLVDPLARHLMLFTNGDSAIDILGKTLSGMNKKVVTIYGSQFDEDQSEEYDYRVLSRILLCMEESCVLILRDLERVYGALYDMLNQSYTYLQGKKMCRVAIGADSNPTCLVHDEFRCIVLKDDKEIDFSDPPFLNRFEKQLLRYSSVLKEEQKKTVEKLLNWVKEISGIEGLYDAFGPSDMFIGFHEDTLSSLVFSHAESRPNKNLRPEENLFEICKADLMWVASPEAVVRATRSDLFKKERKEIQCLTKAYFNKPSHRGLAHFLTAVKEENHSQLNSYLAGDEIGSTCVVMTYSGTCVTEIKYLNCQIKSLSAFNSEKQLTEAVRSYWDSEDDFLILRCFPDIDSSNLLLARSTIENERKTYPHRSQKKHVIILIHVERQHDNSPKATWQFTFCSEWKQIFLDVLEDQTVPLSQVHSVSIQTMLEKSIWPLKQIAEKVLLWCFSCIEYNQEQRDLESTNHIVDNLFESELVSRAVEELVKRWLSSNEENISDGYWQAEIACNKEQLFNTSAFFSALKNHVFNLVRVPLAKLIFFLESNNAWPPHLSWTSNDKHHEQEQSEHEELWCELILNEEIFDMAKILDPQKYGVYRIDNALFDLHFPFSYFVIGKIQNKVKQMFFDQLTADNDEKHKTLQHLEKIVARLFPEIVSTKLSEGSKRSIFQDDVLDTFSAHFKKYLTREQRVAILTTSLALHVDHSQEQLSPASKFCFQLIATLWEHKQRLLSQLQMIKTCLPFVGEDVLSGTISEVADLNTSASKQRTEQNGSINEEIEEMEEHGDNGIENLEKDSQNSEENEEDQFQNTLFANWSEALLPNQDSVEKINHGLLSWITNVKIFLLYARRMQSFPNSVHFLRFCVDFACIILVPSDRSNKLDLLYDLGERGKRHNNPDKPNYLDSLEAFREINDLIDMIERNQIVDSEALQTFKAMFYGRCIETNIDATWIEEIIKKIKHALVKDDKKTAAVMMPVLWRILECELNDFPNCEDQLLADQPTEPYTRNLLILDNALKELHSPDKINDSYVCVVICDIFQSFFHPSQFIIDFKSGTSDIPCIKRAHKAVKILSEKNEHIGIIFLYAVAFLRAFLSNLSEEVSKNVDLLSQEIRIESPLLEINSMFKNTIEGQKQSPLVNFFLKQLLRKMNMLDLQKMCLSSKAVDSLAQYFSSYKSKHLKTEFVFFADNKKYKEVKMAYSELEQSNLTTVEKASFYFDECTQSPSHMLALMELLLNEFFLKRATRKLNDSEAKIAKWLSEQIVNLPETEAKKLLMALINETFFDEFLQLSSESKVLNVQQALLILHAACVTSVTSVNWEPSLLFCCLVNQTSENWNIEFSESYIQSNTACNIFTSLFEFQRDTVIFSCTCGFRIGTTCPSGEKCILCPNCSNNHQIDEFSGQNERRTPSLEKMEFPLNQYLQNTSRFVSHALSLFVYANFYAGMALGLTAKQDVEKTLQVQNGEGINHCLKQVQKELKLLACIVSMSVPQVVCLMHQITQRCRNFMSNMAGKNSKAWLDDFACYATKVLEEICNEPSKLRADACRQVNPSCDGSSTAHSILELDDHAQQPNARHDQRLKRLFRMTKSPSFEGFRLYFEMLTKEYRDKHSFLSLFFAKRDILPKMKHLYHILEWTRYVYLALNHRISREEAKSKKIDDFLKDSKRTDEEKKHCAQLFNKFKTAWQDIRKEVNGQLKDGVTNMPILNEHVLELAYCIIDENDDKGKYLFMAIKHLSSVQNEILDQLLWISKSQNDRALSFFEVATNPSYTTVKQVALQVARKEDIISFRWQDELYSIPYAYNDLDYGMGEIVHYDVDLIAERLAESIAFGKSYLTFQLDKFIFLNEFFDSCGELLAEIQELIPQSRRLPEEVENNLSSNQRQRHNDSRDLLAHLKMLMFLLKRVPSLKKDMSLLSLVDKWEKMLSSPFPQSSLPEPREYIQLQHIVPLCEELESKLADGAIEGLPDDFRKESLTDELKDKLEKYFELLQKHDISLLIFRKILRRFIFRYYTSPNFTPDKTLSACLVHNSLWWSVETVPSAESYPNEITLEYLYDTMKFIDQKVQPNDQKKPKITSGTHSSKRRSSQVL